jgi:hypothetical protein
MGMYTELHLSVLLKRDTPHEIIDCIDSMIKGTTSELKLTNEAHKFFNCQRWRHVLNFGGSAYFTMVPYFLFDEVDGYRRLVFTVNIKNYGGEFDLFLEYIKPHIKADNIIGWKRYEENNNPTVLILKNGEIIQVGLSEKETGIAEDF